MQQHSLYTSCLLTYTARLQAVPEELQTLPEPLPPALVCQGHSPAWPGVLLVLHVAAAAVLETALPAACEPPAQGCWMHRLHV